MTHRTGDPSHVLVVEDGPSLAALYETWLSDACEVTTALGGPAVLEAVTPDVDVVHRRRSVS